MGLNGYDYTQQVNSDQGLRTQYGIILPPGARVAAYVRSTGVQSGDDTFLAQNLVATLAAGMARARSGMGDFVVCLPGHVENVSDATTFSGSLKAGVKIIGVGRGGNTPTFTWTAAAASWAVNQPDVFIGGLRLVFNFGGSGGVTAPVVVTGADFGFSFNEVVSTANVGGGSTCFAFNAGADRFDFSSNVVRSGVTFFSGLIVSVGAVSDGRIADNEMVVFTNASGLIGVGAAAPGLKILRNILTETNNTVAAAIIYSNSATTGSCAYNNITLSNGGAVTPGTTGITVGGTNNLTGFFQNFVVNDPNRSGLLLPVVDT